MTNDDSKNTELRSGARQGMLAYICIETGAWVPEYFE